MQHKDPDMTDALSDILFKDYRKRILTLLLLHADQSFHVREVARLTGTVAGTTGRELKKLAEAEVLVAQQRGNQLAYQANKHCPIFEELASILRKTVGVVDVLAAHLAPLADAIDVAFVFGSVASGKATHDSDIDVMVIGAMAFADVVRALYPAQDILGREINPKVFSRTEWQNARAEQNHFIQDVMEKPKLFLIGTTDDLG